MDRGAHRVAVVLDDVDHRQIKQAREVEGLVERTLVECSITKEAEGDAV